MKKSNYLPTLKLFIIVAVLSTAIILSMDDKATRNFNKQSKILQDCLQNAYDGATASQIAECDYLGYLKSGKCEVNKMSEYEANQIKKIFNKHLTEKNIFCYKNYSIDWDKVFEVK